MVHQNYRVNMFFVVSVHIQPKTNLSDIHQALYAIVSLMDILQRHISRASGSQV